MNRQADVDAVNEAWSDRLYDMSAEEIKEFTDQVVATPGCVVADAHRAWNREHPGKEISYSVAAKYINHYRRHEQKYYVPENRGPKSLLSKEETQKLLDLTALTRRLGWSVTAPRFRRLARGVVRRSRGDRAVGGTVGSVPGLSEFSESWAKSFMKHHGFRGAKIF